ncbi:MAG: cobalt ECF transporter T component CbiQ [Anaerovoracaceae bacterium]
MANIRSKVNELYSLEQLSSGKTLIHKIHPLVKIITTMVFIITVVSFDRYNLQGLVPFVFYPVVIMSLGEIPFAMVFKRTLIALPFCVFAGVSNIIFDREILVEIGDIGISYGVVSFFAIILRTLLCVSAALILVGITPFTQLAGQLRRCYVPGILVTMFEMTYRYIGVFADEVVSMYTAYGLRHSQGVGVEMKDMGTFVGQLLLRSFDRAERIYGAMMCKNYASAERNLPKKKLLLRDWIYLIIVSGLCIIFRVISVSDIYTSLMGGII